MPVVVATPINVGLINAVTRLDILVCDSQGTPVEASSVSLTVLRLDNTVVFQGAFGSGTRITNPATGRYSFSIGDVVYTTPSNPETGIGGEMLLIWNVAVDNVPISAQVQKIWIVSAYALSLSSDLREVIDKAAKDVDTDPANPCFLGYTEAQLFTYLFNGLSIWNMYEPFPTFVTLDNFPQMYRYGLIEAALYVGLTSQELFAVDTDIPNYCFVEGTPVVTADGKTTPIESVKVGDLVLDRTGRTQTVEAAWNEGTPDTVIEIATWGGRKFEVTEGHNFPVWAWPRTCRCGCENKVKPGQMFKQGHHTRLANPRHKHQELPAYCSVHGAKKLFNDYEPLRKLRADQIHKHDFLLVPRKFDQVEPNVCLDEARMLGYYAAEGNLTDKESGRPTNICFTFNEAERDTWASDIISMCSDVKFHMQDHPSACAFQLRSRNNYGKNRTVARWVDLALRHVGEGSCDKALSAQVMAWPLPHKIEFIRGLFRGDGSQNWMIQTKNGKTCRSFNVTYSTSSKTLFGQVQLILAQLGFPTRLNVQPERRSLIRGVETTSVEHYRMVVPMPFAAELAQLVWGDQSKASDYPYGRPGHRPVSSACMVDDDFVYLPVKSVKRVSNSKPVFNLTVSGDHSYLVDNIATYNSAQGTSFVIQHQPALNAIIGRISQRLDKLIPEAKKKLIIYGAAHVQMQANYRFTQLVSSAPSGALFRNLWARA
jgi:hypothetical protein